MFPRVPVTYFVCLFFLEDNSIFFENALILWVENGWYVGGRIEKWLGFQIIHIYIDWNWKQSVGLYIFPSGHQLSVHNVVMTPGEPDKGWAPCRIAAQVRRKNPFS